MPAAVFGAAEDRRGPVGWRRRTRGARGGGRCRCRVQTGGASGGRLVFEGPLLVYATSSEYREGAGGRACGRVRACESVGGRMEQRCMKYGIRVRGQQKQQQQRQAERQLLGLICKSNGRDTQKGSPDGAMGGGRRGRGSQSLSSACPVARIVRWRKSGLGPSLLGL